MNILGLMSGSSIDGLDMALCNFTHSRGGKIEYNFISTSKAEFPLSIINGLHSATSMDSIELFKLEAEFSKFVGSACKRFISEQNCDIDYIASHGHTVFHFPEYTFTSQIGNGGIISQYAERNVICDFRSSDIGAGGLGAPCAPIVDKLLFTDTSLFLNIGGISNISFQEGATTAFDISPANQLLNYIASKIGMPFDIDGAMAASGKVDPTLLVKLKNANQLSSSKPRALDNSWVSENFLPLIKNGKEADLLRTCVEFVNLEIIRAIQFLEIGKKDQQILITGGGALNKFLMNNLKTKLEAIDIRIKTTSAELIEYKEALLIALMGFLRLKGLPNVLQSVTGANRDTIGGCIYVY